MPFEATWADLSGHNMLAMTNSQIFGPLRWFLLEVAKLLEGNALKFSDFEAEILEPDWGTTGHLCKSHSMLLVKIIQSLGNRNQ